MILAGKRALDLAEELRAEWWVAADARKAGDASSSYLRSSVDTTLLKHLLVQPRAKEPVAKEPATAPTIDILQR